MEETNFFKIYVELLQEALDSAESYQDWTDLNGESRYKANDCYRNLQKFEQENLDRIHDLDLHPHTL